MPINRTGSSNWHQRVVMVQTKKLTSVQLGCDNENFCLNNATNCKMNIPFDKQKKVLHKNYQYIAAQANMCVCAVGYQK